jgi:hypothetical protein
VVAAVDDDPGHPQWLPQCQGSGAFCQNAITSHSAPHWIWSCPTSFDNNDSHEQAALNALLSTLELDGVLIQADALHNSARIFQLATEQGADLLQTVQKSQSRISGSSPSSADTGTFQW